MDGVAKMVLNDFMRGKIPWFTPLPPKEEGDIDDEAELEGRRGKLGEMRKRKAEDAEDDATTAVETEAAASSDVEDEDDEEEWGGIQSDDEEGSVAAPTLVGDSSAESESEAEVEEVPEPVKPAKTSNKRRKQK